FGFVSNVWTKAKHLLDSSSTSCSRRNDRMLLPTITSKCPSLCCARMNPPSIPTASGPSGIGNEFRSESVRFRRVRQRRFALVAGSRNTKCGRFPPTPHLTLEFEPAREDELLADSTASAVSWPYAYS